MKRYSVLKGQIYWYIADNKNNKLLDCQATTKEDAEFLAQLLNSQESKDE
jgi:hypothetical protein